MPVARHVAPTGDCCLVGGNVLFTVEGANVTLLASIAYRNRCTDVVTADIEAC